MQPVAHREAAGAARLELHIQTALARIGDLPTLPAGLQVANCKVGQSSCHCVTGLWGNVGVTKQPVCYCPPMSHSDAILCRVARGLWHAASRKCRRVSFAVDLGPVFTVHKAQGSQWDDVVLFDESGAFSDNRERWLYTGVTRAAKRLTVVM